MPAYLETEQELSRLARRAAGMRGGPRLLILPGIMGSTIGRLRKDGGMDVTWFDPIEIAQGSLVKLALPAGNRYFALGVLRFAYERLRLVLRIAGFDAAFHPYDWRRDIHWNGRELADRLNRERRQDVVLVCHSMGGLVARAALAQKGADRIGRVIQLGTPNKGAFVSVQALRGTYPLIRRVSMLDLRHSADELARLDVVAAAAHARLAPGDPAGHRRDVARVAAEAGARARVRPLAPDVLGVAAAAEGVGPGQALATCAGAVSSRGGGGASGAASVASTAASWTPASRSPPHAASPRTAIRRQRVIAR